MFALTLGTVGNAAVPQGVHDHAQDLFADLTPVSDAALDNHRGGFKMGGFDISIGVSVTSSIDGLLEVTSNFAIVSPGQIINTGQTVTNIPPIPAMPDMPEIPAIPEIPSVDIPDIPAVDIPAMDIPAIPGIPAPDLSVPVVSTPAPSGSSLAVDAASQVFDTINQIGQTVSQHPAQAAGPNDQDTALQILVGASGDVSNALGKAGNTIVTAAPTAAPVLTPKPVTTPDPATLTAMDATPPGEAASPSSLPPDQATVVVSDHGPASAGHRLTIAGTPDTAEVVAAAFGGKSQVLHRSENGHLTVIQNIMDGMSIRHSVSVNMTVENFTQVQHLSKMHSHMASVARHVGVYSLRR